MNTLKRYRKEIRRMFFITVNKDIDKWREGNNQVYYSQDYNGVILKIDIRESSDDLILSQTGFSDKLISKYRKHIFISDIKVWWYVRKLKKHFKQKEEDRKVSIDINTLKIGLDKLGKNFIKETRKEKLDRLK
jgi:hypothetical protein